MQIACGRSTQRRQRQVSQIKALVYRLSIPRYLLGRALGRMLPWVYYGPLGPARIEDVASPDVPGPGWVRLRPRLTGICGSDIGVIRGRTSPAQSPFHSFPAILGHEVVADALVPEGHPLHQERVVVSPYLSCIAREEPLCPACAAGQTQLCWRHADPHGIGPGTLIGYQRSLPGGFSEEMLAHESQIHVVPHDMPDEIAVLSEPYAIAVHAVLRHLPEAGDRVLVVGAGAVGLLTVLALQLHSPPAEIHVVARHPHQAEIARALGAQAVYAGKDAILQAAEAATGAKRLRPIIGRDVFSGGFDVAYDCVGSRQSVGDSLRVLRPRGTLVLVGTAGSIEVDWSFVWSQELRILGAYGYGQEQSGEHTFEIALRDLAGPRAHGIEAVVTHRYRLAEYRRALREHIAAAPDRPLRGVFDLRTDGDERG